MAISIDTVYQRVLALANKEQRGYIPPVKFNLFANQAQMDIFEQYFHDRSQFGRRNGNQTKIADSIDIIEEKISLFQIHDDLADVVGNEGNINLNNDFPNLYRLTQVRVDYQTENKIKKAEEIQITQLDSYLSSSLLGETKKFPFYIRYSSSSGDDRLRIYPHPSSNNNIDKVVVDYIRKPNTVNWNGILVGDGSLLYGATGTVDFELHPSEETKLVIKILQLAAIAMKDPGLLSIASQEDIKNIQQEKQ